MMHEWNLDLTNFFVNEARRNLIPAQRRLISTKRGVLLDNAPRNKPATVKAKGFDHWLYETGKTKQNAFDYKAGKINLTLFASQERHPKGPTYEQLIGWHTDRYSGLFTQLPVGSAFPGRLANEVVKQMKAQLGKVFDEAWRKFK